VAWNQPTDSPVAHPCSISFVAIQVELQAIVGRHPDDYVIKDQTTTSPLHGYLHDIVVVDFQSFSVGWAHMDVAQGAHHAAIEIHSTGGAFDQDPGRVEQIAGEPERRIESERSFVRAGDLNLVLGPRRSQHPDVRQTALRADERHGLLAGELTRLGKRRSRLQAVIPSK